MARPGYFQTGIKLLWLRVEKEISGVHTHDPSENTLLQAHRILLQAHV